jgi:hypothetical protein
MPDVNALAETRVRAAAAGLGPDDMTWLDRIGWSDKAVPPIESDEQYQDYRRRERALNAAVAHLSFAERAESAEGRVAATLGARAADWTDREEEGG